MSSDQFGSLFCMPIGLFICFGPVIIGWLIAELRDPTHKKDKPRGRRSGRLSTLAGTIAQTLADPTTDRFSEDDAQFLKFHGVIKAGLGPLIRTLDEARVTTLSACGT